MVENFGEGLGRGRREERQRVWGGEKRKVWRSWIVGRAIEGRRGGIVVGWSCEVVGVDVLKGSSRIFTAVGVVVDAIWSCRKVDVLSSGEL